MCPLKTILVVAGLATTTIADFSCTPSNAYPLVPGTDNGGTGGDFIGSDVAINPDDLLDQIHGGTMDGIGSLGARRRSIVRAEKYEAPRLMLKGRQATFSCPNTSACFVDQTNVLYCADPATGEVVTNNGACGNFMTGAVTACNAAAGAPSSESGSGSESNGSNGSGKNAAIASVGGGDLVRVATFFVAAAVYLA